MVISSCVQCDRLVLSFEVGGGKKLCSTAVRYDTIRGQSLLSTVALFVVRPKSDDELCR